MLGSRWVLVLGRKRVMLVADRIRRYVGGDVREGRRGGVKDFILHVISTWSWG